MTPSKGPRIKTTTTLIPLSEIDYIVLRPDNNEPGITYWLSSGNSVVDVFGDDQECNEAWGAIEEGLKNRSFLHSYGIFYNAYRLRTISKNHTEEFGHHLSFRFTRTPGFKRRYADEQTLDLDYAQHLHLLALLQDMRSGYEASPTKH